MSCVIKEVFLSEHPYFQTWVTVFPDKDQKLYIQEIFHESNITCAVYARMRVSARSVTRHPGLQVRGMA